MKKLYRSDKNKTLGGIMGGLGEYFEIDPTIFRVFALFLIIVTGVVPGIIAYLIGLLIVPKRPKEETPHTHQS